MPGGLSKPSRLCDWNVVGTSSLSAKSRDTSQPREEQLISRLRALYLVPSRFFASQIYPPAIGGRKAAAAGVPVRGGVSTET